jgi:hypothetical protein
MSRLFSPDDPHGGSRESPQFNRSVARAAGELSQLMRAYGGTIASMTFPEAHGEHTHRMRAGEARWDTSQVPAAVEWVVHFAAAGGITAGAVALLKSKSRRKMIARLMTLAGLNRVEMKVGKLSVSVRGSEASLEEACARVEKLAANPDVQALVKKPVPTKRTAGKPKGTAGGKTAAGKGGVKPSATKKK